MVPSPRSSRRHRLCASPLRGAGAALGACLDGAAAALSTKLGNCGGKDVGRFLVALAARALDAPDQRVDVDDFEAAARAAPRGETRDRAARTVKVDAERLIDDIIKKRGA